MQSSMVKVLCILLRYFQDTVSNSIEPCTLCPGADCYICPFQLEINRSVLNSWQMNPDLLTVLYLL